MRASTPTPRSTSGTISANCSRSARASANAAIADAIERHIFSEEYLLRAAASRSHLPADTARAADRRDRPGRRGIRGISSSKFSPISRSPSPNSAPSAPLRTARHPHLERNARIVGRPTPPLPLQLCRFSRRPRRNSSSSALALPGIDRAWRSRSSLRAAVRHEELEKTPGIAETLDWARALVGLDIGSIDQDPAAVQASSDLPLENRGGSRKGCQRR